MTILTTIPNGASYRDIRDTLNGILADIVSLKNGAATPTLGALTLAAASLTENSASGTVVGGLLGRTSGSTLTLVDAAGGRFALSGTSLVAGATATDYEAATSHQVIVRETLAGATGSPRDTALTVTVVNAFEQPNLSALTLSGAGALQNGTAATGAISGATAGSTITTAGLPAGFTINGPARTWSFDGTTAAGTTNATLIETLGDSANSPRQSAVTVTIAAAPVAPTALIFIATGDSKLVGVGQRDAEDQVWPNTYNVRNRAPLGVSQQLPWDQGIDPNGTNWTSPAEYFAKQVQEDTGLPVYVITHGWNGTALMGSGATWGVGKADHEKVVARCNGTGAYAGQGAIKAVMDAKPGAVVAGLIRIEGTNDAITSAGSFTKAQFLAATLAEDADFKARIFKDGVSGATIGDVPTFVLGILPETLAASRPNSGLPVELALREAAATIVGGRYFRPGEGYCQPDNLHETGIGVRYVGKELAKLRASTAAAIINTAGTGSLYDGQGFSLELLADRYVFWSLSGPDAAKFEVYAYTDTTDSNIISSRVRFNIRFVGDATKTYANPDDANGDHVYEVTLNAKAGNGVVTTKQLLVTVEQAYGTTSTGAADFVQGGSTTGNGLFSPSTLAAVAFGRGLNVLAFYGNPSLTAVQSVKVNGAAATLVRRSTAGDPCEIWTVPVAKAGSYPVDITFTGSNANIQLVTGCLTNTVAAPKGSELLNNGSNNQDFASANYTINSGGIMVAIGNGTLTNVSGTTTLVNRNLAGFHLVKKTSSGQITFRTDGSFYWTSALAFDRAPAA